MIEIGGVLGGRYHLLSTLGEGGMGTVFDAQDLKTGDPVAVKVLSPDVDDPEILARFQREARAAAAIDSEHVVRVFAMENDETEGVPFLVMERLTGVDLADILCRHPLLDDATAVRIAHQVCLGLAAAHRAGFVHRDIKPANVFLVRNDAGNLHVKLLDFGVAKLGGGGDEILTQTGSVMGSPHYMSPEQAAGAQEVGPASDLWSLGIMLYRMVTGVFPHPSGRLLDTMRAVCTLEPRPVLDAAPWLDPALATLITRALQRRPDERFGCAEEMCSMLHELIQSDAPIHESEMKAPAAEKVSGSIPTQPIVGRDSNSVYVSHHEIEMSATQLFAITSDLHGDRKLRPRMRTVAFYVALVVAAGALAFGVPRLRPPAPSSIPVTER